MGERVDKEQAVSSVYRTSCSLGCLHSAGHTARKRHLRDEKQLGMAGMKGTYGKNRRLG